jgi:endonuclease III
VKNEAQHAKKVNALLKRIKQAHAAVKLEDPDPVTQLVYAFLEWNASRPMAQKAYQRVSQIMVDNNDLRVSHAHEMVNIIGESYPQAVERCIRLHESLQEVFVREHIMSLATLTTKGKKQCHDYLDSLPGIPDYVVRAVMLALGHATIPVDDVAVMLLEGEEAIEPGATPHEVAVYLEKHVDAKDAPNIALHLRGWCDESTKLIKSLKKTQVLEAAPPVAFELISSEAPAPKAEEPPAASKGAKSEKPAKAPAPEKSAPKTEPKAEKKPAPKAPAAKEAAKPKAPAKPQKKAPAKPAAKAPAKTAAKAAPDKKPASKKTAPKKPAKK